jgi:hypothetical protein
VFADLELIYKEIHGKALKRIFRNCNVTTGFRSPVTEHCPKVVQSMSLRLSPRPSFICLLH